jgi:hypothetical protein
MKRLALLLILVVAVAPAALARRRTVRHPATVCAFSLVPVWGSGSVGPDGLTRALVLVYGQSEECSQWAAYSPVDWIVVEAAPQAAQPGAFVTVAPNPTAAQRNAALIIAGVRLVITQDGAARIAPPAIAGNLLVNGTFDKDVSSWTWFSRFPNGTGTPSWSQFDANDNPLSGSMLLRDSDFLFAQAFQQLQCVRVTAGSGVYEYGTKLRTGSAQGEAAIAILTYASTDCSGNYNGRSDRTLRPSAPGVWQKYDFTHPIIGNARSALIVLASAADTPPFEVWFDDVYLREVR